MCIDGNPEAWRAAANPPVQNEARGNGNTKDIDQVSGKRAAEVEVVCKSACRNIARAAAPLQLK